MIKFKLGEILASKKITATEIHEKTGVAKSTISSIVNNNSEMVRLATINDLCIFLEVTPEEFFDFLPYSLRFAYENEELIENDRYGLVYHGTLNLFYNKNFPPFSFYFSIWEEKGYLLGLVMLKENQERFRATFSSFVQDVQKGIYEDLKKYSSGKFENDIREGEIEFVFYPPFEGHQINKSDFMSALNVLKIDM